MKTRLVAVAGAVSLAAAGCGGGGGPTPGPAGPGGSGAGAPVVADSEVRVVDADTVDIDGTRYRLFGIDAPESWQTCRAWGRTWACGAAATEALRSRAGGMSCAGSETDRYGRTLGVCSSGGEDLNAWLVSNGWALAYRQYADDYAEEEEEARSNGRGMHRGAFVEPWTWRAGERLGGEDTFSWLASGGVDAGALADRLLRGDQSGFRGRLLEESVFGIAEGEVAVSFGAWTGTDPTGIGGAAWQGRMVGTDRDGRERIEGDARIGIDDLCRPEADVAFTGIADAHGGPRADMRWEDVPVAGGRFRWDGATGWVEGRFYGAGHEEAGGVFEGNGVRGAFGGTRE